MASAPLVRIGDRLGLYRALADGGPGTPAELAQRTDCNERYLREWLLDQGAAATRAATRSPAAPSSRPSGFVLTQPDSPAHIMGAFQVIGSMHHDERKIEERLRSGDGLDWGDHDHELFEGTDRFFAPSDRASLVTEWLPGAQGRRRAARGGDARDRRRLRLRDLDAAHGAGLPEFPVHRVRRPPPIDRRGAAPRGGGRAHRPRHVPGRPRGGPARRVRVRRMLCLPARHARSRGGGRRERSTGPSMPTARG